MKCRAEARLAGTEEERAEILRAEILRAEILRAGIRRAEISRVGLLWFFRSGGADTPLRR